MAEKKKLLIVGITMNCAGTEKSFLSFADLLNYDKYDVTLLLAKKEGLFLPLVPKKIRVIELPEYADMFTLTGGNAARVIRDCYCRKNPLVYFELLPYVIKTVLFPRKRSFTAMRLWVHMMRKMPALTGEYDAAVAYWGDKTMFYMVDKVRAKKKITWLHFDYANPPRDDALYGKYFAACDKIVTVSTKIDRALKDKLPEIADRCVMMENVCNPRLIREMAEQGETYTDDFDGVRILTIGRISEQKGYDFATEALARLAADGRNVRWYVLGGGDENDIRALTDRAKALGVEDRLCLLGTTVNPYRYVEDCDIYAQPSRHEGKPIAVEEAKILCKPILVTEYLSAREQLEDGALGTICPIGADGVYEGLKRMMDDPALCEGYVRALSERRPPAVRQMDLFEQMMQ